MEKSANDKNNFIKEKKSEIKGVWTYEERLHTMVCYFLRKREDFNWNKLLLIIPDRKIKQIQKQMRRLKNCDCVSQMEKKINFDYILTTDIDHLFYEYRNIIEQFISEYEKQYNFSLPASLLEQLNEDDLETESNSIREENNLNLIITEEIYNLLEQLHKEDPTRNGDSI